MEADLKNVRVWDLPTRVFHWALALVVIPAIVTVKIGGDAMVWHFRCGYAALALLMFRWIWGVVGSHYARFANFPIKPVSILAYLRHEGYRGLGHNPLGSLSVLAMLAIISLQAVSGLFANDEVDSEGPLAKTVSSLWSERLTWVHADVNAVIIYVLLATHIGAIVYYRFRKHENLVTAMIGGDKALPVGQVGEGISETWKLRLFALGLFGVCVVVTYIAIFI